MDASDLFSGADNTGLQPALGSNFCIRPQNCVFQNCIRADAAVRPNHRTPADLRGRIDMGAFRDRLGPIARFHVGRSPMFVRNHAVDIEIFFARPDVEPIPVIQRNAADPSALV